MGNIIKSGYCVCHTEPVGLYVVGKCQLNQKYRFELVKFKASPHAMPYYKVYPDSNSPDYYKPCSQTVFERYFKELPE